MYLGFERGEKNLDNPNTKKEHASTKAPSRLAPAADSQALTIYPSLGTNPKGPFPLL